MQDLTSLTHAIKHATLADMLENSLAQVKAHPQDLQARYVLFKLYCVDGAWDKALLQLQTLALLDEEASRQTELYKNLVFSEMQRSQVLTGQREATTLQGTLPEWMTTLHQANAAHYQGDIGLAEEMRAAAFDMASGSGGQSDTLGAFSWIADSDGRLGPICEFICAGGYRWLPYSCVQRLTVSEPKDLLDLLWLPATIRAEGEVYYGYIPARYPVEATDSQETKLGLKSVWQAESGSLHLAEGRKVLITDRSECSIMEAGDIVFE